jgi:two-component system chemotaxis response regulator CheY
MRILIVEDDFTARYVLQKILSEFGECDIAVNGEEAIKAVEIARSEGKPYDVIFLDIMMPIMDGVDALKGIRKQERDLGISPEKEVKIIMLTALDTPKDVIESYYKGGCDLYLVKPIEKKKLLSALKELKLI